MDTVDNSGSALSPGVTKPPKGAVISSSAGGLRRSTPGSATERNNGVGPNEAGERVGSGSDTVSRSGCPQGGRDLAKAALAAAKERAAVRGTEPGARPTGSARRGAALAAGQSPRRRRWSGPGSDERDPQPLGRLASRMATQLGWSTRLTNGRVFGQWSALVGSDVAEHAQPVSLNDGELTVRASSTAWATQLRLLQRQLLARIAAGVGNGVVTRMRIQGPTAPSWRKGPRHIPGRGPRDTYG